MVCTWTSNYYTLRTDHCLAYSYDNKTFGPCLMNRSNNITLVAGRLPQYERTLYIEMTIENHLGSIVQFLNADIYKAVLPVKEPVMNLTLNSSVAYTITLTWKWPEWSFDFPPGLVTKIHYRTRYDPENFWHVSEGASSVGQDRQKREELVKFELENLEFANTLYDIKVYVKSASADDNMWSEPVFGKIQMPNAIPKVSPQVELGGFDSSIRDDSPGRSRHITIYWRMIPKRQETGTVRYTVHVYQNNNLLDIKPYKLTKTLAKFGKLDDEGSYTFRIYATNEMGNSQDYAQVTVPPSHQLLERPVTASLWPCGDRRYELSWDEVEGSTSYTIFWCPVRRNECNGYLNWTGVDGDTRKKLVTVEDDRGYDFFLAANKHNSTSGLRRFRMESLQRRSCYQDD